MHLRPATASDLPLLEQLLVAAFNWTGETRVTPEQVRSDPEHRRHLAGWQRPSDLGTVAVTADGEPAGAAWARVVPAGQAGYGFVAEDVPELGLGVLAPYRGRGVGSAVLDALLAQLRRAGFAAVSLSVEDGNDVARRLYDARGFRVVGREGGSDTMLLHL
jgi:ribosomal protein S18 acetylase RimI-like enzyme